MEYERKRFVASFILPAAFVIFLWAVKGFEWVTNTDLSVYGLQPLKWAGLIGIITAPLLHAGVSHLFANSIPLFVLGGFLIYFYKSLSVRIFMIIWLATGLWVWVFARSGGIHIGASGIVYGLASFLFFSGIIRREITLMAVTLLVTFLYGGMVWGVFPEFFPNQRISWESHLMGFLIGLILAIYYRNSGPQRKIYTWEKEEEEDDDDGPWNNPLYKDDETARLL